jgi:ABC-type transport system involved in multi-copper enzyme maturation permease subunit
MPISVSPLLWKEAYHGDTGLRTEVALKLTSVLFAVVVGIALMGLLAANLQGENFRGFLTFYGHVLRLFVCFLLFLFCACVGFQTGGSVCREREQNTLQGLLLLPIDRRDILAAKWLGALVRMRHIAYFLVAIWTIGLLTGAFHPLAILLMALASGVFLACTASLGLLLSVVCRRTLTANIAMAAILFVWFLASGVFALLLGLAGLGQGSSSAEDHIYMSFINPLYALWRAGFGWPSLDLSLRYDRAPPVERLCTLLPSLLWFTFLAWLCWRLANRAFGPTLTWKQAPASARKHSTASNAVNALPASPPSRRSTGR